MDALSDNSRTLVAVTQLTAEVKSNTSAMVELSRRIVNLEISLVGDPSGFGMKTNLALLAQQVDLLETLHRDQEIWKKKNFKGSLFVAVIVWIMSIIYNFLPALYR